MKLVYCARVHSICIFFSRKYNICVICLSVYAAAVYVSQRQGFGSRSWRYTDFLTEAEFSNPLLFFFSLFSSLCLINHSEIRTFLIITFSIVQIMILESKRFLFADFGWYFTSFSAYLCLCWSGSRKLKCCRSGSLALVNNIRNTLSWNNNWVFASKSDFLILLSFQPYVFNLRIFKLWILLFLTFKVYTTAPGWEVLE